MDSLWDAITQRSTAIAGEFHGVGASVTLAALAAGSSFPGRLESLRGRSVLLMTGDQWPTATALVELDGVARRIVLCTPDLSDDQLAVVADLAAADAIVTHPAHPAHPAPGPALPEIHTMTPAPVPASVTRRCSVSSEWILLTSGTTGAPKLVVHTFESLAGALPRQRSTAEPAIWSTFYDIRRYGGLQIYLRAVLSGCPLVLSNPHEPMTDFLARAGRAGVTHISGTPSHWRRALMHNASRLFDPRYVRLSGEVADQPILDGLRAAFPNARIAHAFASTEAGVAFDVEDGRAGFAAALVHGSGGDPVGSIDLKVADGTLHIRSRRTAARYLGPESPRVAAADGFVDTGDLVELVGDRYYFRGRRGGIINVGGSKVFPEEVEAVLNADPRVRMALVHPRPNPITGAIVVADVVLVNPIDPSDDPGRGERIKSDLLQACRQRLARHKVPASLRFVVSLPLTSGGKLMRPNA